MEDFKRLLARFEPEGLGPEGPSWQHRKSAQTRISMLDAAVDCLANHGYAHTTVQLIAETSGVSRGAMLHHYPKKGDLTEAIIAYCFYKRMELLVDGVKNIAQMQRIQEFAGLEVLWQSFLTPEYRAYVALNIASRTDAEVREIFIPRAQRFTQVWREEGVRLFPEWAANPARLAHASDLAEAVMEGLALNAEVWTLEQTAWTRAFLRRMIGMIFNGDLHVSDAA